MNILAIENSSFSLSVAVKNNGSIFQKTLLRNDAAQYIVSIIDGLLKKAKLPVHKLDLLTLGLGPGSFTGLRIACTIAKAISFAHNIPLIGLSSFWAIAEEYSFSKDAVIIFDAKKNLIYGAVYAKLNNRLLRKIPERLIGLDEFLKKYCNNSAVFIGESIRFKKEILRIKPKAIIVDKEIYPKAKFLIKKAEEMAKKKKFTSIDKLEPLYLHPETCQIRKLKKV